MYNCSLLKFVDIKSKYGHLTPIEEGFDVPFDIKRIFYISKVPTGLERGSHAHRKIHQVLICVNGTVKVRAKTPKESIEYILDDATVGLYLAPYTWSELYDFSEDAVLLVLASDYYNESEYIRNIDIYMQEAERRY